MCRTEKGSYSVSLVLREKKIVHTKCTVPQACSCFAALSNNGYFPPVTTAKCTACIKAGSGPRLALKLHPLEDLKALYTDQLIKPDSPPK